MDPDAKANLKGLRVVSFESRRAKEMAELVRRYGGEAIVAPSIREVPLSENHAALELLPQLEAGRFDFLILMTGVGARTLNEALLTRYPQERILAALEKVRLVARGPKPVAVLKELGLQPAVTIPEPNTWREILAVLESGSDLYGKRIAIQEYGIPNPELISGLEERGATVAAIPIYRWALPENIEPLQQAIGAISRGDADLALFTNGAQVDHLFQVAAREHAESPLREAFKKMAIGSVGPVCSQVLAQFGLKPDIEPAHPKMGALVADAAALARAIVAAKRAR
ncbi:MAG TPA: uroporphyrinogen-III synthase [Candidatus Acidoferrales bacterium]|nr:uroporphyrinogen-III synthase [Candidatus Acidoferrales bacterium]